ncbi:autoinducer exporter family protein [Thermosynechococcus sp. NK55a]|uniref:AI-2E family transporter n=1 Tax=unclassified Thermosynechococcus TaxID=2622553 RepID=UPI0003D7AE8F|nr:MULTISPECIES: AI-2E family transporter [unclassified Thermosynechococcus]AHB88864.1 autoinducer exporter family protein [Thermosynechococcus sp. NK55a]
MRWSGPPGSWQRYLAYLITGPLTVLNLWVAEQVYLYFEYPINILVIAAILAFLLNQVVIRLCARGLQRRQAIALVLLITLLVVSVLMLLLLPLAIQQAEELLNQLPELADTSNQNLRHLDQLLRRYQFPVGVNDLMEELTIQVKGIAALLPSVAITTVTRFFDTLLVLILTVYMLFYGSGIWRGLMQLVPKPWRQVVDDALRLNIRSFFSAQLFLGLFMFLALIPFMVALQVNFGFLFALIIGVAQLIPVVGATLGIGFVTLLILFQDAWLALNIFLIAVVLQQIKDNVLAPKLLGNLMGLNPLWQFIALLIGARVAGFLGILLAIPLAATVKVVLESPPAPEG